MEFKAFERKKKEDKPVLAICYDFDKTLSPDDMQAQGYIQSVGYDVKTFWTESDALAVENEMDQNLAYMFKMVKEAEGNHVFNRKTLADYGAGIGLFPGVEGWFERMREYGREKGVIVEHYIISSGLKEMIEGTQVAKNGAFEKIYASSFYYNEEGVAVWPAQVVNFTNKTQFLFRIEKGVLDVNDTGVNECFSPDEIRVPFRNIVYIGDSDTDVPCMKLVNTYGGHSIGVYNPETQDQHKVSKMLRDNRIRYIAPADYSEGTELDELVKAIIDRTACNELLENAHYRAKDRVFAVDAETKRENKKESLIMALEGSGSFANTHTIVKELSQYGQWSDAQRERLMKAALENKQIKWILQDEDVSTFYKSLLPTDMTLSKRAQKVKRILTEE